MSSLVKPQPSLASPPVLDGTRFALAAAENTRFPTEELPVLRVLDSFVFLSQGAPTPLPAGWLENTSWAEIEVIGAVATMTGPTAPLAQCGWITRLKWRWIRITSIRSLQIRQDSRFRKGEPCFWLTTPLGEYAILAPHRGYSALWNDAISQPDVPTPPPTFRRVSDSDSMPSWWDVSWDINWPPSIPKPTSAHKRTASAISRPDETSADPTDPDESCLDGERRVRRRDEGEATATDNLTKAPAADSSASTKPATEEIASQSCKPNEPSKPKLGVAMYRLWDVTRDRVDIPKADAGNKPAPTSKKVSS
ncbi:hypothetical protein FRC11_012893 [Ceratobasidium sp. 423]|nr:hypothetical protein FRC11_012893 [Ceratobasidium sp. 423]